MGIPVHLKFDWHPHGPAIAVCNYRNHKQWRPRRTRFSAEPAEPTEFPAADRPRWLCPAGNGTQAGETEYRQVANHAPRSRISRATVHLHRRDPRLTALVNRPAGRIKARHVRPDCCGHQEQDREAHDFAPQPYIAAYAANQAECELFVGIHNRCLPVHRLVDPLFQRLIRRGHHLNRQRAVRVLLYVGDLQTLRPGQRRRYRGLMARILVTSASGANGDGYGAILGFTADGALTGPFSQDSRISDPRGLSLDPSGELVYLNSGDDRVLALGSNGTVVLDSGRIDGLDPGGGAFGPDGRYYVGLRRRRTIFAFPARLDQAGEPVLPDRIVPFPRGFGFGPGGELYLASGIGPSGEGENTIAVFDQMGALRTRRLVDDPELSPLDLAVAPNGNIIVSSEWPYGSPQAKASVREYDPSTGRLVRVFAAEPAVGFARPRGLRVASDGRLYCVGKDHVVSFSFATGRFTGVAAHLARLNGQALVLGP
jgi:hypothetical protein